MLLKDTDEIRPGQELTVEVGGFVLKLNTREVENDLVQAFNGTLFKVGEAQVPAFEVMRVFGSVPAISGLTTTAPHRNLLGAEFRFFVDDRLSRVSGIVGAKAEKIHLGRVEGGLVPPISFQTKAFAGAALAAVIVVAVAVIIWKVA